MLPTLLLIDAVGKNIAPCFVFLKFRFFLTLLTAFPMIIQHKTAIRGRSQNSPNSISSSAQKSSSTQKSSNLAFKASFASSLLVKFVASFLLAIVALDAKNTLTEDNMAGHVSSDVCNLNLIYNESYEYSLPEKNCNSSDTPAFGKTGGI